MKAKMETENQIACCLGKKKKTLVTIAAGHEGQVYT